jgi:hypothetical protein
VGDDLAAGVAAFKAGKGHPSSSCPPAPVPLPETGREHIRKVCGNYTSAEARQSNKQQQQCVCCEVHKKVCVPSSLARIAAPNPDASSARPARIASQSSIVSVTEATWFCRAEGFFSILFTIVCQLFNTLFQLFNMCSQLKVQVHK